jgi:hypothetical protein
MKKLYLISLACLLLCCLVGSASAQVGDGWDIGDGWDGMTPTPSPTPTSQASQSAATTFNAAYGAISLIGVAFVVSAAALIITAIRSSEAVDPKIVLAGIVLIIVGVLLLIVAALIIGYFEVTVNLT